MISLSLSCAAALALAGLPDDAPVAAEAPASAAEAPSPPEVAPAPEPPLRPAMMPYTGGPVPPDYELSLEYNAGLLVGGMSALLVGYTGATLYALIAGFHSVVQIQRGDPFLALVPLFGPFLGLGGPGYRSQVDPDLLYVRDVVLLCDAAVQWVGAAMAGVGYFFPAKVLRLKESDGRVGWILPLGPSGTPGLSWMGTFGP